MANLIQLLSEQEKKKLLYQKYEAGKIIFLENSICNTVGFVIKGEIDIVSYSFSGKEIIYNVIKEDGMFGNNLLFSDDNHYRGNVTAVIDSQVAYLKKEDLLDIMKSNEQFLEKYLQEQANFGKKLNLQIKLLSFNNAEDRLHYYMLTHNGKITFNNVTSLAKTLYLERETLSRLITKLVKQGIISRNKHQLEFIKNR